MPRFVQSGDLSLIFLGWLDLLETFDAPLCWFFSQTSIQYVLILNWITQIWQSSFIFQRPHLILISKHKNCPGLDIKMMGLKYANVGAFSAVRVGGGGYAVYHAWTYHFMNIDRGSEHFGDLFYPYIFFSLSLSKGWGVGFRVGRTGGEGGGG